MRARLLVRRVFFASLVLSIAVGAAACNSANETTSNIQNANAIPAATTTPSPVSSLGAPPPGKSDMGHGDMMMSSAGAKDAPYDLQFIDTMMSHHKGAVEMAMMAETKAGHAELKSFAAKTVTDQQKEINQMKEWRDKWYAGRPEAMNMEMPGMTDSMKGMDMTKMNSSTGNNFDLLFIDMMTPHHQGAVLMGREALQKAEHPEIKRLAQQIITSQEAEIKKMQAWKAEWSKQ
jgi:uncharacterized protein (DUF305 family)